MSSPPLPRHSELRKLAAATGTLRGSIPLCELERLRDVLMRDDDASADVELRAGIDDEGYRFVAGRVRAGLLLQCQRCLDVMRHEVDVPVSLALVWREAEIPSLPSRYEALVTGTTATDLHELVEEELLLALPLVARHPDGECCAGVVDAVVG